MARKRKKKQLGPVIVIVLIIITIAILSLLLNLIGFGSSRTVLENGNMETTLVVVKNIISVEGIKYIISNSVSNFKLFEPLVLFIISLFGISLCEKSGFLNALFAPFKRVKLNILIFLTVLVGIISTIIGDYSYIFLLPLVGVAYKSMNKNPVLGIMTIFLGITIGYGTGIIFNYNEHVLSQLTMASAKADIDATFYYGLFSNLYIKIIATFIMTFVLTILIDKYLIGKVNKRYVQTEEEQELIIDSKAKGVSILSGIIYIMIVLYLILPIKLPLAGILLDTDAERYIDKLFGTNSPFGNGLVLILTGLLIICGHIYGRRTGNIKTSHEFSLGLSKNFENLGIMFVFMFFVSLLYSVIEWTNIGVVVASSLVELMGNIQFSGLLLIITFFIVVILMSVLIPNTTSKWEIASPLLYLYLCNLI